MKPITLNELTNLDEFKQGSYERKKKFYSNWVDNDFGELTANDSPEVKQQHQNNAQSWFETNVPEPKGDAFGDDI